VTAKAGVDGEGDLPVDDVRNAVVEDAVCEHNLCVVDVCGTVRQDCECEVGTLKRWDGHIAQRRREDDVVGDDVVCEDILEGLHVHRLDDGANVGEGIVGGDKDGEV
jgi:hypothetical protein